MGFLRLIVACLFFVSTSAYSNGILPVCNVDMAIGAGTSVMKWVKAPVNSTNYTITSTASTYRPGGLTPITISVANLDSIYIGLLLVAYSNGSLVGQWKVLEGDDFFVPASCKFGAVVHASAELKPITQTFYWKGAVGTGQVTFRALIKHGEQNRGNFFKPTNLVLNEGTPIDAQTVWKGEPGDSCDETCGKRGQACDNIETLALSNTTVLQRKVAAYYACREPYLSACAPPAAGANSYCFASNCRAGQSVAAASVCSYRTGDPVMNQAFCVCKPGTVRRDPSAPASPVNSTVGVRLNEPMELDAELVLNDVEVKDGVVTVDVSGPIDRWFAIGWDADYMQGTYATVISLNDPTIRPPQNYDKISDKGYADAAQGWYDVSCQQALNDYCRNVGASATRYLSCALANATSQSTPRYNASAPNPQAIRLEDISRVPCKDKKIAPYLPMTVGEYILNEYPTGRNATQLASTITIVRSLVDAGQWRVVFKRPIAGFPNKKSMNLIWAIGVQQYFGKARDGSFIKHSKKSDGTFTLNLSPVYETCEPDSMSAAPSSLPSMLLLSGLIALGSKNWMLGALFAVLVHPVAAHNWMNTGSRAQIAAVTVPCQARVDPAPHLQVAPGQEFQMEWSTGHGDTSTIWTYFVLLNEADYDKLIPITDATLNDYLANAPSYLTGEKWTRRHLSPWNNYIKGCASGCNNGSQYPDTFTEVIKPGSSRYIERNSVAVAKSLKGPNGNVTQFWYPQAMLEGDLRAQYKSLKYPWMLSVHKFRIAAHWPDEYDIATFSFPTGLPAGNYIAHFKWGGYRDCTDVHIVASATPVANPWGLVASVNNTATFTRLDHCEYTYVVRPATTCIRAPNGNVSQCLADCLKAGGSCTGVQAVRKVNPAGTMAYTPNYPTKLYTYNQNGSGIFPPPEYTACDSRTIHKRVTCADPEPRCNVSIVNAIDTPLLCYGLKPYRDQDFQTVDDFVITNDPRDPGFYSTCWVRLSPGGFLPYPEPKVIPPVWRAGKRCVSCDWLKDVYSGLSQNTAPDWTAALTDDCRNCDLERATSCEPNIEYVEGGNPGNCTGTLTDGQICSTQCNKGFTPFGPPRICKNGVLSGAAQGCTFKGC